MEHNKEPDLSFQSPTQSLIYQPKIRVVLPKKKFTLSDRPPSQEDDEKSQHVFLSCSPYQRFIQTLSLFSACRMR